jgi:hypothetical protein
VIAGGPSSDDLLEVLSALHTVFLPDAVIVVRPDQMIAPLAKPKS